jgi:two-component system phosphate regulon sensor histidine kinase PhoR
MVGSTTSQSGSDAEQLHEARQLLEQEQRRYQELFDLAPVGYLLTDLDGVVLEVNEAASELLAREVGALLGTSLADFVATERRREFRELLGELARGARWQDEFPFLAGGGGSTLLLVYAAPPDAGVPGPVRWALADAPTVPHPQRRSRSEAASGRLDRLSHVLDRLHHGVITVDPQLRVSYANAAAEALFAESGSLAGKALADPWPEPSLRALVGAMFEADAKPAEEHVMVADAAEAYDVLALPPDATGHALLVVADVSSARRRERAEREFVANAAHQLRTPVSAIASAIEVLQGGAKEIPEARDRFLSHLDSQCNRLVRLTRALLLLARAQALSEPPEVELVHLCPLLEGIGRGLRPDAGVAVHVDCPGDLAALTNRDLLEQALENLAENAAKFTREGEIVLSAATAPEGEVSIVVSDTGPGAKLPTGGGRFERFSRDPAAEHEGFGLGLAIADEALRVVRAGLVVEATAAGTRAIVTLPSASVLKR